MAFSEDLKPVLIHLYHRPLIFTKPSPNISSYRL